MIDDKKKKVSVWDGIPTLAERADELLRDNILLKKASWRGYADKLNKQFEKELAEFGEKVTIKTLHSFVDKTVWTKEAMAALKKIVGFGLPLKKFTTYPFLPLEEIERKAREETGKGYKPEPAGFRVGFGLIGDLSGMDDDFELPETSFEKPAVLFKDSDWSNMMVINGANIGLRHRRILAENPVKGAVAEANRRRDSVVILTNMINVNIIKAGGPTKIARSLASGLNLNVNVIEGAYKKVVEEIIKKRKSGTPRELGDPPELIYLTVAEKFRNVLAGWQKIMKHQGKPEYNGPVAIFIGYNEENIIKAGAYWETRILTVFRQQELDVEKAVIKAELKDAKKVFDNARIQRLKKDLKDTSDERARTIISNITEEEDQRYAKKAMHFVVQELEKAIPSAKVLGCGTTFVKAGDDVMEISIPEHAAVKSSLLHEKAQGYGPQALTGKIAKTHIICHPYAPSYKFGVRELIEDGKREDTQFFVAPVAMNMEFLAEAFSNSVTPKHHIKKLLNKGDCRPGVLSISRQRGSGGKSLISADAIPIPALIAGLPKIRKPNKRAVSLFPQKHIIVMQATDLHFGSRAREELWPHQGDHCLGVTEGVMQMMRDAGLVDSKKGVPVHMITCNDDLTQGNHYDTHLQPDPQQISVRMLEKMYGEKIREIKRQKEPREVARLLDEMRRFSIDQFRVRGMDWLQEQVEEGLDRLVEENIDFFSSILWRSLNSKLDVRGVSQYIRVPFDARDLGIINFGTGNHFEKTVWRTMTEGFIFQRASKYLLRADKRWSDKKEWIDQMVRAPRYSNKYFAWGTVGAPGGYQWGIEFRADPTRLSSWADVLMAAVSNDFSRGDYGKFMTGRMTLKMYGDKHHFAATSTNSAFYYMSASNTHEDQFGQLGFHPNNTGISFICLPAEGPDSGPILVRTLRFADIRKYFEKPYDFDWEGFLPNPV